MIPSEFGQKRKLRLSALTVSKSAWAADKDLADDFCYGVVTGRRPGSPTDGRRHHHDRNQLFRHGVAAMLRDSV